MSWQNRLWAGFEWSKWAPLSSLQWSDVPEGKGMYRIRSVSPRLLAYVGQGNLRDRIVGTWRRASRRPFHSFSPLESSKLRFLAENRELLGGYEVAWTQGPPDLSIKKRREGHECRVLWRYRLEARQSALVNYGRPTRGLNPVGISSGGLGAKTLFHTSSRPAQPAGRVPHDVRWMGFRWSHLAPKTELKRGGWREADGFRLNWMRRSPVLYKALGPRLRLRKVGYKQSALSDDLFDVFRDLPKRTLVSWANLSRLTPKHHFLELVSDLIGAHLEQTGRVASCQF